MCVCVCECVSVWVCVCVSRWLWLSNICSLPTHLCTCYSSLISHPSCYSTSDLDLLSSRHLIVHFTLDVQMLWPSFSISLLCHRLPWLLMPILSPTACAASLFCTLLSVPCFLKPSLCKFLLKCPSHPGYKKIHVSKQMWEWMKSSVSEVK